MNALTFQIRLVEPLLTTQARTGEANSAVALPFIPGSMIRGVLVGRYLNGRQADAMDTQMQELFLSGRVRFLNAYPAHPTNGTRSLPKPLSWFVPKEEAHLPEASIFDFAVRAEEWAESPKSPGCGDFYWHHFLRNDDENGDEEEKLIDLVELYTPAMQVAVHNFSKDRSRKDESSNEVYRYDALAADERFAGVILADDKELLTRYLQPLLEKGELCMGRSHTGGYGRIEITEVTPMESWQEYNTDNSEELAGDQVRLICLSDMILRNPNGHILNKLEELAKAEIQRSYWRLRLVGGFNRKWGLPLPQAWAIQAGSVFVFPSACKSRLQEFVERGIGERLVDGYGRVAVSCHTRPVLNQQELPRRDLWVGASIGLTTEERGLLEQMANRQLQAKLDHNIKEKATMLSARLGKELPSPAQLSRARLAARRAWLRNDLSEISRHFQGLSKITLRKEWDRAMIEDETLQKWITQEIENQNEFNSGTECWRCYRRVGQSS